MSNVLPSSLLTPDPAGPPAPIEGRWVFGTNRGMLSGGAPIDSIDAAASFGMGVGILAVLMTIFAMPVVAWLSGRGPLSLRKVLLLGAALGNVPLAFIIVAVVVTHPIGETLSGDVSRFWYGYPGLLQRVAIGLACRIGSAAAFWVVAVHGTEMQQRAQPFPR
jgi:hypothetical protein